jgi:hypothetical protein
MTSQDTIAGNPSVVEAHFHREATSATLDVVWKTPAGYLIFRGRDAVAANYRSIISVTLTRETSPLSRGQKIAPGA